MRRAVNAGKISHLSGKNHNAILQIKIKNVDPILWVQFYFFLERSANVQCAGKRRCNLKAALLGKIHGCVNIALFAGQLHALNVLYQLAILQTLILRKISFLTIFAWRRNHGDSFHKVVCNWLKTL